MHETNIKCMHKTSTYKVAMNITFQRQKKMKPHPLDDTSTATKTWKTEQHRTNISNIIIFGTQDLSKILRFEVTMVLSFSLKKTKKSPLDDTSTAIKTWKTQPHRTNVGDIIIFDTQDVSKFLHLVFISKWKPRNLLSMIPAQPQKPERHSNTEQTSAISSFLINRMHHRFYVSKSPWSLYFHWMKQRSLSYIKG